MRDFIWTLIIIWTIYQLSSFFRNRKKKTNTVPSQRSSSHQNSTDETAKVRMRKAGDQEGEYVDFEEIK